MNNYISWCQRYFINLHKSFFILRYFNYIYFCDTEKEQSEWINVYFCKSVVSDGMTIFSPVSSARYRRSSVSINPSCPSQVSMFNSDDAFTVLLQSVICWPSSIISFLLLLQLVPLSPFSLTGDRLDQKRQVRTERVQTRPPQRSSSLVSLWGTSVMFSQSVQSESRSGVWFDRADSRRG